MIDSINIPLLQSLGFLFAIKQEETMERSLQQTEAKPHRGKRSIEI
jgi:hypothetical protein